MWNFSGETRKCISDYSVKLLRRNMGNISCHLRDYQCWNFGQTNDIRHIYLTGVNKLREAIPAGNALNSGGGRCPKGKNIYKLNWDCILEGYAQETVDKCEENPTLDSKLSSELSMVYNNVGSYGSPIYFMGPRACNQCLD
ncbi:hypothetical protein ANCCEY_14794, partial [Ancylostoma ceylanicum]